MTRRVLGVVPGAVVLAAGIVAILLVPQHVGLFRASQLAYVAVYFIAVLGLNILTGYTGQISLGHGAFMAVGGYTTAILVTKHGIKDLWTIPIAAAVAGVAGLLVGVPALRLRGLYLALATFGIAVSMPFLLRKFEGLTGGREGLQFFGLPTYTGGGFARVHVLGHALPFEDWLFYLSWTLAVVGFVVAWLLLRGRLGRSWRAVRDSEIAASSSGVNPALYKTVAFGVSAAYAGVAGSLYALLTAGFVNPDTYPIALSMTLVVGAVVAGLGSLWGVLAGAALVQFLPDLAQQISKDPGVPSMVYGVVLILVVLLLPGGAGGLLRRLGAPLTSRLTTRSQ